MSRTPRQKSKQWEVLLEKVSGKLDQVKSELATVQIKQSDLEEKQENILTIKQQYSSNLIDIERSEHDMQEAMRLRKFMIHLDKTLSLIKREFTGIEQEKMHLNEEFLKLEKERLKFETLKKRAEKQYRLEVARKEDLQRDLSNSIRYSKPQT